MVLIYLLYSAACIGGQLSACLHIMLTYWNEACQGLYVDPSFNLCACKAGPREQKMGKTNWERDLCEWRQRGLKPERVRGDEGDAEGWETNWVRESRTRRCDSGRGSQQKQGGERQVRERQGVKEEDRDHRSQKKKKGGNQGKEYRDELASLRVCV